MKYLARVLEKSSGVSRRVPAKPAKPPVEGARNLASVPLAPGKTGETPAEASEPGPPDWQASLARLHFEADADGILRDDPGDLFNRLADAGQDQGVTLGGYQATLEEHAAFLGSKRR